MTRLQIEVEGVVQGVGFRPLCYQLAQRFALSGWVLNHGGGVTIEIQGDNTDAFIQALKTEPPGLARIDRLLVTAIELQHAEKKFTIRQSQTSKVTSSIPADTGVCPDCLHDLFNPDSRYYHYPFLNCSHCGPRYTVTRRLPYDRAQTSLAEFSMCGDCHREYQDPTDRRFHAQPTACPNCGPKMEMAVTEIVTRLKSGEILAIKGLGGFHLVCDARNDQAVQTLRQRKNREQKPFAVMAANLTSLKPFVELDAAMEQLLESPQRPIVIAQKKDNITLSANLAPGLNWLGVMLPYTPLHYLLFNHSAGEPNGCDWLTQDNELILVMTSANAGGEPLVINNDEAQQRLSKIADAVVCHNRDIVSRADDSVMRIIDGAPIFIRRARGFVPQAIKLPHAVPAILAVGGHLKNTICITRGDEAFISQHIGDLENRATCNYFEETLHHLLETLEVTPTVVAHDSHPDFFSTRFAQQFGAPTLAVQHHHAHLAAVAAEHGISQAAIGLALDGFGLGENNQSWGGELMLLDGAHYQRLGHLAPLKQPGADRAAREPWRMAAAVYERLNRSDEIARRFHQAGAESLQQVLNKNINCPATSSAGRLFDAAAGLLGIQAVCNFEGQAAMMLESLVTQPKVMADGWHINNGQLDLLPLLERLIDCDPVSGANLFHGTLIAALSEWLQQSATTHGLDTILLAGGCFLNQVLSNGLATELRHKGFMVKLPQQAPCNDGGLSLGQAWIAGLNLT